MKYLLNKLVRVTSYRGNARNRVARVVNVRDTHERPLKRSVFKRVCPGGRSRYLITIHDLQENVFRSYYHQYVNLQELGWFSRLFNRLSLWWEEH